jgi:hypothetical protein
MGQFTLTVGRLFAGVSLAATCVFSVGCGDDEKVLVAHTATPTRTATRTPTPSATPTVTSTPSEPAHTENIFGSTAAGGGALTVDAAAVVEVPFSTCLGSAEEECAGGTALYVATDPGFESAEEDEPEEPLFVLEQGTSVALEIVEIDEGITLKFGDTRLPPNDKIVLGTTPLHRDLEWQLGLPGGLTEARQVRFKLTTTSSRYVESEEVTVTLQPTTEDEEHEHDDE